MVNNFLDGGKNFCKAENVKKYISSDGVALQTLYNSQKGVLVYQGKKVTNAIFSLPVYVYENPINNKFSPNKTNSPNPAPKFRDSRQYLDMKKKTLNVVGHHTVELYEGMMHDMDSILNRKSFTPENFEKTKSLVDVAFDSDRTNLHQCVKMMRTKDSYTFNHSISVFLLFSEAMLDFRSLNDEPRFFEVFKQRNSNVNFNTSSIKMYSMGALLHDYGKMKIDSEILTKPEKLSDDEFQLMMKHPLRGVEEMQAAGITNSDVLEIIGNHHPAYKTFENEHVSPLTQIVNILDIYDACRSNRSYKEKFSASRTLQILGEEMNKWNWDFFIFSNLLKVTITRFEKANARI
ncbi:MAG: HD domain-containing protein [Spirochaetales bacterium]|nr:HD domain-containing protein [Spirochaetales bacterium]